jgi:hypothetical protein
VMPPKVTALMEGREPPKRGYERLNDEPQRRWRASVTAQMSAWVSLEDSGPRRVLRSRPIWEYCSQRVGFSYREVDKRPMVRA